MKTGFTIKDIIQINLGMANIFFIGSLILLAIYIVAPLFGGEFIPSSLIYYGSLVALAICMKYEAQLYKNNKFPSIMLSLVFSVVGALCMYIWLPHPYNFAAALAFIIMNLAKNKKINNEIRILQTNK